MSSDLHDLHVATETKPGPPGFFDHPFLVLLAVLVGFVLGVAVMAVTDVEPRVTEERNATDGVDIYVRPDR